MNNFPKPRNEYIILKPDPIPKDESNGGFIIPQELKQKPHSGTVVAASEGYYAKDTGKFIPIDLKKDDRVLYTAFGGATFKFNGVDYWMLKESEITVKL